MSEESQNDGTMSGLVKTLIGTVGTIVTAGGAWLGSQMFGGGEQPAQPAAAAPVINITNSNQQSQRAAGGGGTKVIERVIEKPAAQTQPAPAPKPKKKEGDEFKEEKPQW
jgi:hypothetical protein